MKKDILAGLRSAVERGEKLEDVVKTFVNAGYNEQEVREAAREVSMGASGIVFSNDKSVSLPVMPEVKKRKAWLVALIISFGVLVLGGLGLLIYFLVR